MKCKMHWQSSGDYLCVKVDRHTKTKKSTYTNFELFRIREKDIPIEQLEIKDQIVAFAWYRFCLLLLWFVTLYQGNQKDRDLQ
jgi:uncharacterized protein with WD repeat